MTKIESSKIKMYLTVQLCMKKHKADWENIPYIANNVALLNLNIKAILEAGGQQMAKKTGVTKDKDVRKDSLIQITLLVVSILKSYASFSHNKTLQSKLKYSLRKFKNGSENDFLVNAGTIHTLAKENLTGAAAVGLNQGFLDDLLVKKNDFANWITAPADERKINVNATRTIKQLISETDDMLEMSLDNDLMIFAQSKSDFYLLYRMCRKLPAMPTIKLAMRCKITDAITKEALPGARITIKDHDIDRKSSPKGQIHVRNLKEGKHAVTVSMDGYVTQVVQITYKAGETTMAEVKMKPVK